MKCAVSNCISDNKGKACNISFFPFPKDAELAEKWIQFCQRENAFNTRSSFVCMKHFSHDDILNIRQFEMGFAKRRILKQGVLPTIYLEDEENTQPAESIPFVEDESKWLQQGETDAENEFEPNVIADIKPFDESVEYEENTLMGANISVIPTSTSRKVFCCNHGVPEVQELETELESLKIEYKTLIKEIKKKDIELATLQYVCQEQKANHVYEVEQLQKRLDESENVCRNMESKLQSIFTKGQIAKFKYGIKKPTWTQEDIDHSMPLYSASPKAFKLLYKKGFPLPGVRTLQKWAKNSRHRED